MRVLFALTEGRPHLYPSVPLAWALYAAGHDVRMACEPRLVDEVVRAGLPAVPVGGSFDLSASVRQDPDQLRVTPEPSAEQMIADAMKSLGLIAGFNNAILDDLTHFAERWRPDLVLWDPLLFAGPVAARRVGAVDARILFGLDLLGYWRQALRQLGVGLPAGLSSNPLLDWLGEVYQRFDLPMDEDDALMGQYTIDPFPPRLRLPVERELLPMRYIPYNGRAVPPDWLLDPPARPRIALTGGTTAARLTGADAEALSGLDVEVFVGITDEHPGLADFVPPNVRVVQGLSFHLLLPTCAAVVHHGGAGTTMTAAVHGVPQLVLPQLSDQHTIADQVAKSGAGIALGEDEAAEEAVRESAARLLADPAYRVAAAELREEIRQLPKPADVVTTLENLTGTGRV
jgi:glycosyltransferase (activator-dependent family)